MTKKLILLSLFMTVSLAIVGCGSTNNNPETPTNSGEVNQDVKEPVGTEMFKVGDRVKMGNLEFKVNGVRSSKDGVVKINDGYKYLYIDITVENVGVKEESVSSIMQFSLKDKEGREQEMSISGDSKGSMDGPVPAGGRLNGEIAYEVLETLRSAELQIKGDLFSSGIAIIPITIP